MALHRQMGGKPNACSITTAFMGRVLGEVRGQKVLRRFGVRLVCRSFSGGGRGTRAGTRDEGEGGDETETEV